MGAHKLYCEAAAQVPIKQYGLLGRHGQRPGAEAVSTMYFNLSQIHLHFRATTALPLARGQLLMLSWC